MINMQMSTRFKTFIRVWDHHLNPEIGQRWLARRISDSQHYFHVKCNIFWTVILSERFHKLLGPLRRLLLLSTWGPASCTIVGSRLYLQRRSLRLLEQRPSVAAGRDCHLIRVNFPGEGGGPLATMGSTRRALTREGGYLRTVNGHHHLRNNSNFRFSRALFAATQWRQSPRSPACGSSTL